MNTIRKNASGTTVQRLQYYLNLAMPDAHLIETGVFDDKLVDAVKTFQKEQKLRDVDGIVGPATWNAIFKAVYKDDFFSRQIINQFLTDKQYYHDLYPKKAIYLHHTAGNFNPKSTLRWWEDMRSSSGKVQHIATAFVVGRKSSIKNQHSEEYDGKVYRAFNEINWAHHLGYKWDIDKRTIGIEICAFGWLHKDENGFYYQAMPHTRKVYLNDDDVHVFDTPWRGQRYFEKYTEKQIAETKRLVLTLAYLFDIQLPDREYNREWFGTNKEALAGAPGLWTHVNVRKDKTDCFPQPEFIDMLNSLHEAQKTFLPNLNEEIAEAAPMVDLVVPAAPDTISSSVTAEVEAIPKSFTPKSPELNFETHDLFRHNDLDIGDE